ncbi:MAG: transposase, partial [Gammaproteobacteria bacterium]|nr:transposase [Gammaproteobacteria bacterium]
VAQPMHRRLGMPCDALSVVNVVAMHHQALRNWWRRPDHYDAPSKRAPERYPVNPYVHNQRLEVADGRVRLFGKKVGWMRWRAGRQPSGKIMSGRVSFRGGHWYLAIQFEGPAPEYAKPRVMAVGVDPGIRAMTAHDGERCMEFCRVPERSKSRRRRLDRKIDRCRKGSRRWRKLTATRARQKEREANARRDRSHKATRKLIDHARIIGYEDPSAKAWQESGMFGEASREAAAGEFCRQIAYKGGWAERDVVVVPESMASTQSCYACGERTQHALGLKVYRCSHCGHTAGRDENAALNVRAAAIQGVRAARPEAAL